MIDDVVSFDANAAVPNPRSMTGGRVDKVKIGALCWNQYTDSPALLDAGVRADRLGFDTLWTCVI